MPDPDGLHPASHDRFMNTSDDLEGRVTAASGRAIRTGLTFGVLAHYWGCLRSLPNTLRFNLKYFPLKVALKLPVLVSHRVLLKKLSGSVELGVIRRGIVRIGFGDVPLFDSRGSKSVLIINGTVRFRGSAKIGPGNKLGIDGELVVGDGFSMTAFSLISARKRISIGRNVMVSWEVSIFDHDWHDICDRSGMVLNPARPVDIGDDVWVCCRALILKGCRIPDGVIIAAGTTVAKSIDRGNAIIGADGGLRVLKEDVFWRK